MSIAKELKRIADTENAKKAEADKQRRLEKFFDDLKKGMFALAKEGSYVYKFSTPPDFNIVSIRDKLNEWGLIILQMRPEDTGHYFEVTWM